MSEILTELFSNIDFCGLFVAALLAFFFNRKLNKATKKQEDLDNFYAITMDINRIHNELICMYKSFAIPRQKEINLYEACNKQIKVIPNLEAVKMAEQLFKGKIPDEDLNRIIISLSRCRIIPELYSTYTTIQGSRLELFTDIKKLSFMNEYNPFVMDAALILGQSLSGLNQVIDELNKYIDRHIDKESNNNNDMVFSTTKSCISKLDSSLAFANIASDLLFKWGKIVFKDKFKIVVKIDHNNSKFNGILPNGYEYLISEPLKSKIVTRIKKFLHDLFW